MKRLRGYICPRRTKSHSINETFQSKDTSATASCSCPQQSRQSPFTFLKSRRAVGCWSHISASTVMICQINNAEHISRHLVAANVPLTSSFFGIRTNVRGLVPRQDFLKGYRRSRMWTLLLDNFSPGQNSFIHEIFICYDAATFFACGSRKTTTSWTMLLVYKAMKAESIDVYFQRRSDASRDSRQQ